ncbi:hypothetical protein CP532_5390 [Ophiocordyceps camponoti-leonardi (nom. inval.)]|nr:hypothetical protein CP532_5390 [Ophiocordyceps camponoti-leonardi (nom. inval.)]
MRYRPYEITTAFPTRTPRQSAKAVPLDIAAAAKGAPVLGPSSTPTTPSMCVVHRNSPPSPPSPPSPSPASVGPTLASRTELRRDLGERPRQGSSQNTRQAFTRKSDASGGLQGSRPRELTKQASPSGSGRGSFGLASPSKSSQILAPKDSSSSKDVPTSKNKESTGRSLFGEKPAFPNRNFIFPGFFPFDSTSPFLKRPDDKPPERTVEKPAAEATSTIPFGNNQGQTTTRNVNNQPPRTTSTTRPRQPGQNQAQPPRSTSTDVRNPPPAERTRPASNGRTTRTSDSAPTSGIQEAPIETSETQSAGQESSTSTTDERTSTPTNERTSRPTDEPTSRFSDEPSSTSTEEQTSTTENPSPFGSSTSTVTDSSSDGGITSATPLRLAPTDSPTNSNPRNTRRPSPAVRSTLDTSASALPASTPAARPSSAAPLGNTGTENGIGGNLQNQGSDRPPRTSPRPTPVPSDAARGSRALPTKSVVGIVVGVSAAVLILGLSLWIGRKLWRKVQAKKRINRLPSPFYDSSSSDIGQRDVGETTFRDATGARFGAERLAASMGYHGSGARSQAENSMAEFTVNEAAPQLWETSAIPGQGATNWGASMKGRFMGLWPRRADDTAFDSAPRGGLSDGATNYMGGGSTTDAAPQNLDLPLNQDGFGILNPFADSNAVNVTAQEPAYLAQAYMEGALDPFSDGSVIQSPQEAVFAGKGPRSHRRSVSASVASSRYPPSVASTRSSRYPASVVSRMGGRSSFRSLASSFADRRNKFRSDPFDLEIEGGLPNVDDVPEMPPLDNSNAAYMSHMRAGSQPTSSSYYTSGVGTDWNLTRTTAAGPAIDPAAAAAFPLGPGAGGEAQFGEGAENGLR